MTGRGHRLVSGIRGRWVRLRQSFWLLPALMCVLAAVLAEVLIVVDRRFEEVDLGPFGFLITRVGETGSRDLLGAVAGSMLTVASTTFSITIAALALASSTYGPRLVRNFMADRGNQVVLGVFLATFLYSLLVLRSIRVLDGGGDGYFVPHLAVNVAVLLAVVALGVLVYFIHHIAGSIQVGTLSHQVRLDLTAAVERLYPLPYGQAGDGDPVAPAEPADRLWPAGSSVPATDTGYVQDVDVEDLVALAGRADLLVTLRVRPGDHVIAGMPLVVLRPSERVNGDLRARVRKAVHIAVSRTPEQDVAFSALLLEEMAVRALSPGTNDPYTAVNALDDLSAGLGLLATRHIPSGRHYDQYGELRVTMPPVVLGDLLDHLLDALRWYAIDHPIVLHRALDLVGHVGSVTPDATVRASLTGHAQRLVVAFQDNSRHERDVLLVREHAERVCRELADPGGIDHEPARR